MFGSSKYRRGYTGRDYHVTGGHEAEAEAAQRAKGPSRIGTKVLRLLGYKGTVEPESPHRASSPQHEKRHRSS
jgi:hypothetical protein